MKRTIGVMLGTLLLLLPGSGLSAQIWQAGRPGDGDVGSLSFRAGRVMTSDISDVKVFKPGMAYGASASWWTTKYVGVRWSLMRGYTEGEAAATDFSKCTESACEAAIAVQDPQIWLYGAELVARFPMLGASLDWFPYVSYGVAGKSYRWAINRPTIGDSTSGWTYGGGIVVRPAALAPFGFSLDVSRFRSLYKWHSFQLERPRVNDLLFTVSVHANR